MEHFKTSNALLQNSLSYVGLLSTSPAFRANDAQLASAADALAAAVLYVSRDTSNDALKRSRNGSIGSRSKRPRLGRTRKSHGRCWPMLGYCMNSYRRSMKR